MKSRITRIIGRRFHIGPLAVPLWTIALAVVMVGAVAGQAVGPVLDGSVSGTTNLVVEQAVLLDTDRAPEVFNADDSATTMNDDRTAFTVAIETQVGQLSEICLYLENNSGQDANARLVLNVPPGIDVEVEEFGKSGGSAPDGDCDGSMPDSDDIITEAQYNANTWVVIVDGDDPAGDDNNDGLRIKVEPHDDAAPGFYTISGTIVQVEN